KLPYTRWGRGRTTSLLRRAIASFTSIGRKGGGEVARCLFGEIGNLVLLKASFARNRQQLVVHRAGQIFIHAEFAGLQLRVKRRVLLVNDFVTGEMLGTELNGLAQRASPNLQRLARNGEHQIEIQIVETGTAEDFV